MKSEDTAANFALLRFAAGAAQRRTLIVGHTEMMILTTEGYADAEDYGWNY